MNADCAQFTQKERILAKDPGVYSLIEVHSAESRYPAAGEFCTWSEPKIANLGDDLFEPRRRDNVVVHQDQVLLRTVERLNALHNPGERLGVPLLSFELRDSTERAFPDAPPRRIGEIGVMNRVSVWDLRENTVVRYLVFDRLTRAVIRIQLASKIIELKRNRGTLVKETTDEPHSAPTTLLQESLMHQRGSDSADENAVSRSVHHFESEINRSRDAFVLEGKEGCHVDPVP